MIDARMQQVFKQVKKAVEAAGSVRPLPHFKYVPTEGCEPSYRRELWCPPVAMGGCKRPLMLVQTGGRGRNIAVTPLGPMHTLTIA